MENGMNNGAPQYGAPQYGAPQYGAPQYGAPQYGAPQYDQQPQYGAPQYDQQPQYGAPQYAPQYDQQPQYGAPQYAPAGETKYEAQGNFAPEMPAPEQFAPGAPAPEMPAPEQPAPEKPKKGGKAKKILPLAIIGGIVVVAAIVAAIILSSPKMVMAMSLKGAAKDLANRSEIAPIIGLLDNGSVEVDGNVKFEETEIDAGGKFYLGKEAAFIDNLNVLYKQDGEKLADLSASVYLSRDYWYIENEEILGGAYGMTSGSAVSAFENSLLNDEEYLDEEMRDLLRMVLEVYDDQAMQDDMQKDLTNIMDKYTKKTESLLDKYAEFDSDTDKVKVGGERINARIVTVTIDGEAMVQIAEEMIDMFKEDDELRDFVVEWFDYFSGLAGYYLGTDMKDVDIDEMWDEMIEMLDEVDVEEMMNIDEDMSVVLELVTPKMSNKLLKLTVTAKMDKEKQELICIDLGEGGVKKTDCVTVSSMGKEVCKYEIKEDSKSAYKASLTYKTEQYDYESYENKTVTATLFSIDVDRTKDTYKLKVPMGTSKDAESITVKGDISSSKNGASISVTGISGIEELPEDFKINVTITLKSGDKISGQLGKDNYDQIDDITLEVIDEWIVRLEDMGIDF